MDCPGLVMPSLTPMESQVRILDFYGIHIFVYQGLQVLSGILPISRVSAIPLCIHHIAQLLPLEQIYKLQHPSLHTPTEEDKRTWREPRSIPSKEKEVVWTAFDILTAHALQKGWVTAKAGRPDVNRSGNASMFRDYLAYPFNRCRY